MMSDFKKGLQDAFFKKEEEKIFKYIDKSNLGDKYGNKSKGKI